jgi:peptide/nickel transport system permease protein
MISVEHQEAMARLWGLDQPLHTRYLRYIVNMFTFNFGISFMKQTPVIDEMLLRLRNTLLLLSLSLTFNVLVGVSVGMLAASRRGTKIDAFAMSAGLFTWGAPIFYIQLLFVFFLANPSFLMLFPRGGMTTLPPPEDPIVYIADLAYHLALPLLTLVIAQFGWWAMYVRSMMLDTMTEDYIVTARAVGLSERKVLFGHAFRATLPPFVTLVVLIIPTLLMGGIITEYIFSWPGTGQWFLYSVENGDYPAAQALLFLYAILTVAGNFAVDLIYGFLDPRIRVGARR